MERIKFEKEGEVFRIERPDHYNYLYFPTAGEKGLKSSLTPNLGGDCKLDQNRFALMPVSAEDLHNSRMTRNFWCETDGGEVWSMTGVSAQAALDKNTEYEDESYLEAGYMWQKIVRESKRFGLRAEMTTFVVHDENIELTQVTVSNQTQAVKRITVTGAIPIYGRSAENLRDHRHVTSLLHHIWTAENGVFVRPRLSFDERGHQKNETVYYVLGSTGEGELPECFFADAEEYIGEGGTFETPLAVYRHLDGHKAGETWEGREAVGGIRFAEKVLEPGQTASYLFLLGVSDNKEERERSAEKCRTSEQFEKLLEETKQYWKKKVNVSFHSGDERADAYLRWISFQPFLRRIYGCSFLPHHDYGKGGRGWRDLWQDCLALLVMDPQGVRQMILDNYAGVRMDGTNATIIGERQGEFKADRNNIARVWMDHGFWPYLTTKLYMDQTGDVSILAEEAVYFKDGQIVRGTASDESWSKEDGTVLKCADGSFYKGSVLEHILVQQLGAFFDVGEHNVLRLRGADWNDAIDMAAERGESVAFSCSYAYNLRELAEALRKYQAQTKESDVLLAEELGILFGQSEEQLGQIAVKRKILETYGRTCASRVSGKKIAFSIEKLAEDLLRKAGWLSEHIRKNEWVTDGEGFGWFNGYYDNSGRQVEGVQDGTVRMMLTSQVFAVMGGIATDEQVAQIAKSARRYLYAKEAGGYRLNTDFKEEKYDMGRMFGFAYGEKENGAVFSHMTVMFANALYQRGFVKEGYYVIHSLLAAAMDFEHSKIYPGIPEYFRADGRGMYHYLTGAASWFLLTMLREVYGVAGEWGSLVIKPHLVAEQFDGDGAAKVQMNFAGKEFCIICENPGGLDSGEYRIVQASCDGKELIGQQGECVVIEREMLAALSDGMHEIKLRLGEK